MTKDKILILILIVSSFKLMAQHPDLQHGRWYVQSLTVNSVTTEIPNDPIELPFVYLVLYNTTSGLLGSGNTQSSFPTNCNAGFVGHANYIDVSVLEFIDFTISQNFTDCNPVVIDFMNLYLNFYNDEITEQFIYSITTETDNSKTLLITNHNGDTITYTNRFYNSAPQELSNNTWYLHNLIVDGYDNIPPNNEEFPYIDLIFNFNSNENALYTYACDYLISNHIFDDAQTNFYIYDFVAGLASCNNYLNVEFHSLYINDFFINNLPGPFTYNYEINGSIETLIITNAIGNQAIYGNYTLSNQSLVHSQFSVYPNPVKNNLIIKENTNGLIQNISIYNSLGSKIIKTKSKNINMSKLTSGIYVLKIKLKNGKFLTKKIIKN